MFPYSWFIVFSISMLAFFSINSSWSSFFSSPLVSKKSKEESSHFLEVKDFWF